MIKWESEKDFENFIVECFATDGFCIVDDEHYQNMSQQFDTCGYGIPDLVFYSQDVEHIDDKTTVTHNRLHVIELKNEPIKLSHISQIARYKRYFERALESHDVEMKFSLVVPESVKGNDDVVWLLDSLDNISVMEFTLDPKEGIKFDKSIDWYKVKENKQKALDLFDIEDEDF